MILVNFSNTIYRRRIIDYDDIQDSTPGAITIPPPPPNITDNQPPMIYSTELQIAALTVGIAIVLFGFLGNLLTIITIVKTPTLRRGGANLFILNLSLSDLLICCFIIPARLPNLKMGGTGMKSLNLCRAYAMFSITLIGTSLLCQVGTAVSRFLRFIRPTFYQKIFQRNKKRTTAMMIACWVVPYLVLLPSFLQVWGEIGYDNTTRSCKVLCTDGDAGYCPFYYSLGLFIPAGVIIYCYLRILHVVCSNHKRINSMRIQMKVRHVWQQQNPQALVSRSHQDQREDLKFTRMMLCVFVVFLICYFPYAIYALLDSKYNTIEAYTAIVICAWLSACLNPLVYVLLNSNYRNAIINMLACKTKDHVVNM